MFMFRPRGTAGVGILHTEVYYLQACHCLVKLKTFFNFNLLYM
jgi:hypothetical protein